MVGFVLRSRGLTKQTIAADGAHVSALGAENARISEESDVRTVCSEDIPTVDEGDELPLRAE